MMTPLTAMRDDLATITGVLSCKIGLEPGISPADFPLIRIVPERMTPGQPYGHRTATTLILFGVPITASEPAEGADPGGMQEVYQASFALEALILAKLRGTSIDEDGYAARYVETVTDADQLNISPEMRLPYKAMYLRCEVVGAG